jgi:hypothetical protein
MRLEHVCDMELAYQGAFVLSQPYGSLEGAGFGIGAGVVSGDRLAGTVRWVNHPRRRSDGSMLLDAHAVITTEEGCDILCTWQGRAASPGASRPPLTAGGTPPLTAGGRQVLAALFEAEDARYHWLNQMVCIAEGHLHPETLRLQLRIYACLSDLG